MAVKSVDGSFSPSGDSIRNEEVRKLLGFFLLKVVV